MLFWTCVFSNLRYDGSENQSPSESEAPDSEPFDGVPTDKCLSFWFSLKMFPFTTSKVMYIYPCGFLFPNPQHDLIVRCASAAAFADVDSGEVASNGCGVSTSASGEEESDCDPYSWIIAILHFVYAPSFTCPQEDSKEILC